MDTITITVERDGKEKFKAVAKTDALPENFGLLAPVQALYQEFSKPEQDTADMDGRVE